MKFLLILCLAFVCGTFAAQPVNQQDLLANGMTVERAEYLGAKYLYDKVQKEKSAFHLNFASFTSDPCYDSSDLSGGCKCADCAARGSFCGWTGTYCLKGNKTHGPENSFTGVAPMCYFVGTDMCSSTCPFKTQVVESDTTNIDYLSYMEQELILTAKFWEVAFAPGGSGIAKVTQAMTELGYNSFLAMAGSAPNAPNVMQMSGYLKKKPGSANLKIAGAYVYVFPDAILEYDRATTLTTANVKTAMTTIKTPPSKVHLRGPVTKTAFGTMDDKKYTAHLDSNAQTNQLNMTCYAASAPTGLHTDIGVVSVPTLKDLSLKCDFILDNIVYSGSAASKGLGLRVAITSLSAAVNMGAAIAGKPMEMLEFGAGTVEALKKIRNAVGANVDVKSFGPFDCDRPASMSNAGLDSLEAATGVKMVFKCMYFAFEGNNDKKMTWDPAVVIDKTKADGVIAEKEKEDPENKTESAGSAPQTTFMWVALAALTSLFLMIL